MKRYLVFLIIFSISSVSISQDKSVIKAMKGFDDFVESVMKDHHVPGLSVSIVKDGKVVWAKGYGYRDVENKVKADENTLFAIGSSSKAFTSFGVMKLSANNEINLSDPIKDYLPDFDLSDDYIEDRMTAIDILSHRSGLPRHDMIWYGSSKSRDELFSSLSDLEFSAGFRERWQYQNLMFMTAGVLIERVSGKSWEQFTQDEILNKIGMKRSNFTVAEMQSDDNSALPYVWADSTLIKMDYRNIDAVGPAGSINSSAVEMAEWLKLQLGKGTYREEKLLPEGIFNMMHSPQMAMGGNIDDNDVFHNSYGLGWFISSYRGHKRVEHGGNIDGFSANVGMLPLDNIGVVVLTNLNGNPVTSIVRNNVFDRLLGLKHIDWNKEIMESIAKAKASQQDSDNEDTAVSDTSPSHSLEDFAGDYSHANYGDMNVSINDGNLTGNYNSMNLALNHYHYDVFEWDDKIIGKGKIQFHMDQSGDITKLTVSLDPNVSPIEFEKTFKEEIPKEILETYVGVYILGEMEATIRIDDEGALRLLVPGQPEYLLEATSKTKFKIGELEGYSVEFKEDELVFHQPNGVFKAKRK